MGGRCGNSGIEKPGGFRGRVLRVLSFHPLFEGDDYRICAGREPDGEDLAAIRAADAVILPQGCREPLFRMAREHCPHVFPNYDARFRYPRKPGQIRLFRDADAAHPPTEIFASVAEFRTRCNGASGPPGVGYPLVFKFAWGGEGETVFFVDGPERLTEMTARAEAYEKSGQKGFLLQAFVPPGDRTLRVAVIGATLRSYWRVGSASKKFGAGVRAGARIDPDSDPRLQEQAVVAAQRFCRRTGINLAGFDFLFDSEKDVPLFLEINYFFGRRGLGGSERYYALLLMEIERWVQQVKSR